MTDPKNLGKTIKLIEEFTNLREILSNMGDETPDELTQVIDNIYFELGGAKSKCYDYIRIKFPEVELCEICGNGVIENWKDTPEGSEIEWSCGHRTLE